MKMNLKSAVLYAFLLVTSACSPGSQPAGSPPTPVATASSGAATTTPLPSAATTPGPPATPTPLPSAATTPGTPATPTAPAANPLSSPSPNLADYLADTGYERLTEEHNFGTVKQGTQVSHTFTIENKGTELIQLGPAQTTSPCCVSAELSAENVEPGGNADVVVRFDTTHWPGPFFANVVVPNLSGTEPKAFLFRITGDVSETIVVDPGVVVVDKQGRGSFLVRSARFKSGLKIVKIESDPASVAVTPGPVKGEQQTFSIDAGAGKEISATIRLVTNDKEVPDMLVGCQSTPPGAGH